MSRAQILRHMADIERDLAATIAQRAVAHPDPNSTKALRSLWNLSTTRANYFDEMAVAAEKAEADQA